MMAHQETLDALAEVRASLAVLADIADAIEAESRAHPRNYAITGDAKRLRHALEDEVGSFLGYRMRQAKARSER